jgi:hypothetical protein
MITRRSKLKTSSQIADHVLSKLAESYDAYGNLMAPPLPIAPMALGGVLGGSAAHLMPTEGARELRELADKIPEKQKNVVIKLIDEQGKKLTSPMAAEEARKLLRNSALRRNSLRMLGGIGAGAGAGYALSQLLGND